MITRFFEREARPLREARCPPPPGKVVVLFDDNELAVRPFRARGYEGCVSALTTLSANAVDAFVERYTGDASVVCVIASPPCANLCAAGARWWPKKRRSDPEFQDREIEGLRRLRDALDELEAPYCILLPCGGLIQRALGKGLVFDPADYGEYAPENHPVFPEVPGHDAYKKKTVAYLRGLRWPSRRPVPPVFVERVSKKGRVVRRAPHMAKRRSAAKNVVPLGFVEALVAANC